MADKQNSVEAASTNDNISAKKLLTAEDVSKLLSIELSTLYNWTYRKKIPHIKLSNKLLRFRLSEIESWIATKAVAPASQDRAITSKVSTPKAKGSGNSEYVNSIVKEAKQYFGGA